MVLTRTPDIVAFLTPCRRVIRYSLVVDYRDNKISIVRDRQHSCFHVEERV
jgi:hypothetical protein